VFAVEGRVWCLFADEGGACITAEIFCDCAVVDEDTFCFPAKGLFDNTVIDDKPFCPHSEIFHGGSVVDDGSFCVVTEVFCGALVDECFFFWKMVGNQEVRPFLGSWGWTRIREVISRVQ